MANLKHALDPARIMDPGVPVLQPDESETFQ